MTTRKITRCIIYARNSIGRLDTIQHQIKVLTAYADGLEWVIVAVLQDGVSAYHGAQRDGYEDLLRMVAACEADVVLTMDQDRLSRADPIELERIIALCQEHGVRWATPGTEINLDDPDAVTMARVRGAFARGEIDKMRKRQQTGFDKIAARGERVAGGQKAFGYQPMTKGDTVMVRDDDEAEAVAAGAKMILEGKSITDVMRDWNARGLKSPQAGQVRVYKKTKVTTVAADEFINASTVRSILVNQRNIGLLPDGKPGKIEPILDVATYRAVVAELDKNPSPKRGDPSLLGGRHGAGRCVCGNTLGHNTDFARRRADGTPHGMYRCDPKTRGDRPGPHVWSADAAEADRLAAGVVLARASRPDFAALIREQAPHVDIDGLSAEAATLRAAYAGLIEDRRLGLIERADLAEAKQRTDRRLAVIDAEIASAAKTSKLSPLARGDAREIWPELDHGTRRAIVADLVEVVLSPTARGKKWNPELIEIRSRHEPPRVAEP